MHEWGNKGGIKKLQVQTVWFRLKATWYGCYLTTAQPCCRLRELRWNIYVEDITVRASLCLKPYQFRIYGLGGKIHHGRGSLCRSPSSERWGSRASQAESLESILLLLHFYSKDIAVFDCCKWLINKVWVA